MGGLYLDIKTFDFKYLPQYAAFLLTSKLEEFVTVGIRFNREVDLPMLKPLSKLPEKELVNLSLESNTRMLSALRDGNVRHHIETNLTKWTENNLGVIDKGEIIADDLVLAFYVRRKLFTHFLYSYTPNTALHQLIISEVDTYTTYEELATLKLYLDLHKADQHID